MVNPRIARAVRLALVTAGTIGAGLGSSATLAQDQDQDAGKMRENIEVVVVTGSRIPQPNIEGTSPITVTNAADIKVQGLINVEDLINNLPQVFADQGGNVSNGASGTATVNLRNLDPARTLVLVNGRRLPAGSPRDEVAPDLNQIPAPLIERVEILTGGASAVYGSDAVAGVVNFIMNDQFEGLQFDVNYNFYNHSNDNSVADIVAGSNFALPKKSIDSDGKGIEVSVLMGSNFADDRGNATVFLGYREIDPLLQSERDYSACALASDADGFFCGGSSTSFPGRFIDLHPTSTRDLTVADAAGNVRPFTGSDLYNYGPLNYYQRPDERYSFNTFAHYDLNDYAQVYSELAYHDDRTVAQIAPSGLFGLITDVSCSNPLLSAAWVDNICTQNGLGPNDTGSVFILRRNVEGGGRQDDVRHTSYRAVIGVKGEFAENWNYDVAGQYGTVVFQESYLNDFSVTRAARAMDVITDPDTGLPACRSAVDGTDPNCVPYDIWRLGGVTPEALAYLQTPGFMRGDTEQTVVTGTLAADLSSYGLQSPLANRGIGIAFGAEYREETLSLSTDQAFETGDLFGQGGPEIGVSGGYNVTDLFLEIRAPLVEDRPGFRRLGLNGSYRNSDYSTGKSADTYGIGLDWAPLQDVKFRASYQQAVRAANILELFDAQAVGLYDNDADPCAGVTPIRSLEECARTGVTAAQYGRIIDSTAQQYNALFGGNPDLDPETSKSTTFGLVFTPTFLENFSMTLDYFNIEVEDAIDFVAPTDTLEQCLDSGDPLYCDLITRDQLGTLWATPQARIVATNINIGGRETSGWDFSANYRQRLGSFGALDLNFIGTKLDEFIVDNIPGLTPYDCAGLYGSGSCGTPLPEWRHKLRATWATPWNLDLSLTWRFFDSVTFERASNQPRLAGTFNEVDRKLDSQNYLDFVGSYTFMESYTFRLGINNLTDEDPPVSSQVGAGFGNGNTYPQVYDALGRYVFLNFTAKF